MLAEARLAPPGKENLAAQMLLVATLVAVMLTAEILAPPALKDPRAVTNTFASLAFPGVAGLAAPGVAGLASLGGAEQGRRRRQALTLDGRR
ncbi:UNVERIFIED_CONTAM: hypothetical protein FKN15_075320 [Acipenser sinensis]